MTPVPLIVLSRNKSFLPIEDLVLSNQQKQQECHGCDHHSVLETNKPIPPCEKLYKTQTRNLCHVHLIIQLCHIIMQAFEILQSTPAFSCYHSVYLENLDWSSGSRRLKPDIYHSLQSFCKLHFYLYMEPLSSSI